jgi:hypothetical protein
VVRTRQRVWITNVLSSITAHSEVYWMQHYVIKFVADSVVLVRTRQRVWESLSLNLEIHRGLGL